jgi:hypothetical protein
MFVMTASSKLKPEDRICQTGFRCIARLSIVKNAGFTQRIFYEQPSLTTGNLSMIVRTVLCHAVFHINATSGTIHASTDSKHRDVVSGGAFQVNRLRSAIIINQNKEYCHE